MITEDFLSFEVAKLLKEKGFDEPCTSKYCTDGSFDRSFCHYKNSEINKDAYNAPTYQMAMKWLRDVHKLSIEPFYMFPSTWEIDIKYIDKKTDLSEFEDIRDKSYNSYEEAVEAACLYALKNLL